MPWVLRQTQNLSFSNDNNHADITHFGLYNDHFKFRLVVMCNEQGADKILSRFGTTSLREKFLASESGFGNIYRISNGFLTENVLLAINDFYYISKEHRALISKNFQFPNLFYNEDKPGRLAISLALRYGFEAGYQSAKKELRRTNNESSCMDKLAEYDPKFAKEITRRKSQSANHFFSYKPNNDMDVDIDDQAMSVSVFAKPLKR